MTHEFRNLITIAHLWQKQGHKVVMATVVAREGSSYRRPGVRMLVNESGEMMGAVSGGCVEKEVLRQSQSVFKEGKPKMMAYDGRYRLGCEGVLYVLLEPIAISEVIYGQLQPYFQERIPFACHSYFFKQEGEEEGMGSVLVLKGKKHPLYDAFSEKTATNTEIFSQEFSPIFQLYIFGAEHDAVELCKMGHLLGWDVYVVATPDEEKTIHYFEGATALWTPHFDALDVSRIDAQTAVVLMSHSFHKDVQYLMALRDVQPAYFGLLGPKHRRERLFSEFLDRYPDTPFNFFEQLKGPAGIDIGAESASEIAVSIVAEILSTIRKTLPQSLQHKTGNIHD
ncbi:MAG: XdhC family protein [Flavobacteriaceae bacterium]